MRRLLVLIGALVCCGQTAMAGGFQIGEMAARSTGMGNAFTAVADDASAAWYNPAGVAFSEDMQLMLGSSAIIAPGTDYMPNVATISLPGFPAQAATSSKSQIFIV
ncbi:MAG: outer membrane protein transport protein, partial [Mariprofundus sp.]|nr:outer membrane protein transport protein [Mariprofundus sp.]